MLLLLFGKVRLQVLKNVLLMPLKSNISGLLCRAYLERSLPPSFNAGLFIFLDPLTLITAQNAIYCTMSYTLFKYKKSSKEKPLTCKPLTAQASRNACQNLETKKC